MTPEVKSIVHDLINTRLREEMLDQQIGATMVGRRLGHSKDWLLRRFEGRADWRITDLVEVAAALGLSLQDVVPLHEDVQRLLGWLPIGHSILAKPGLTRDGRPNG